MTSETMTVTGALLVAHTAQKSPKLYRQQARTAIASTLPPLTAGAMHVLEVQTALVVLDSAGRS